MSYEDVRRASDVLRKLGDGYDPTTAGGKTDHSIGRNGHWWIEKRQQPSLCPTSFERVAYIHGVRAAFQSSEGPKESRRIRLSHCDS